MTDAELLDMAVTAFEQIAEGKGAYSRDPLEHCANTVEEAKRLATVALETVARERRLRAARV